MDIGARGTGNWRWAVLWLGITTVALAFAVTCYIKGLAVGFTTAGAIVTIVAAVVPVVTPAVKWARNSHDGTGGQRGAADLVSAFARNLREFASGAEPAELRVRLARWRTAEIADYISGARLAPWEFVANVHAVVADSYHWSSTVRAQSSKRLLEDWTLADAAVRRLRSRTRARTLVLAAATAAVVALAVTTGAVIELKGKSAPVAAWRAPIGTAIDTMPAVTDARNGKVYVTSEDHVLYARDAATGRPLWNVNVGAQNDSSPAVADGMVYIGSWENQGVYALDAATGKQRWFFRTKSAVDSSPLVVNGLVYIGSDNGYLYAIGAMTGKEIWYKSVGGEIDARPAFASGNVYVGSYNGYLYSLNAANGSINWRGKTQGHITLSGPAVAGGLVFVGSTDGKVYAFDTVKGTATWTVPTHGAVESSPVVAGGVVYIGSNDFSLYAIDATSGHLRWSPQATAGYVECRPAVDNGTVYFVSDNGKNDGNLWALNAATGQVRWEDAMHGQMDSSPVVAGGTIYVGSDDGTLYALNAATGKLSPLLRCVRG